MADFLYDLQGGLAAFLPRSEAAFPNDCDIPAIRCQRIGGPLIALDAAHKPFPDRTPRTRKPTTLSRVSSQLTVCKNALRVCRSDHERRAVLRERDEPRERQLCKRSATSLTGLQRKLRNRWQHPISVSNRNLLLPTVGRHRRPNAPLVRSSVAQKCYSDPCRCQSSKTVLNAVVKAIG